MVRDVEEPDADAVAREAQVFLHVFVWAGLDDDRSAVLARAEVWELASVQETLDGLGVGFLSLVFGHRRRSLWRRSDDS